MSFRDIEKKYEINLFFFYCNSFFKKSVQRLYLSFNRKQRITGARCSNVINFSLQRRKTLITH